MALFFDIDDTLVNHSLAEEQGARIFFKCHASRLRAATAGAFVRDWRDASTQRIEQFLKGAISFDEQRRRRCKDVVIEAITSEEADQLFASYLEAYESSWMLFNDVLDVLQTLKSRGVHMGVISNGSTAQQLRKLSTFGLLPFFEHVLISEDLGVAKPDKVIFEIAAERIGHRLENCMYVGDCFESDVRGALAAGMQAVWVDREARKINRNEPGGYHRVQTLHELLDFTWLQDGA